MKTILIPIDFSEAANNAVRYAAELSASLLNPVDLVLLHVYENRKILPTAQEETELQQLLTKEEQAIEQLQTYARAHCQSSSIRSCRTVAGCGSLSKVIVRMARQINASLIVMGTKGGYGQNGFFASNNTSELVDHAPFPVLIVPEKLPFRPLLKMVFAADFSPSNVRNIQSAAKLALALNTQLQVVHVSEPGHEKEQIEEIVQFWSQVQQEVKHPWLSFVNLEDEEITNGLEKFALEQNADLVVVCPKRHSAYYQLANSSTTRQLVLDALVPVLALPRTELDELIDGEEAELFTLPALV